MLSSENQLSDALKAAGAHIRSPLALNGIMISILRHRFGELFPLPYQWKPLGTTGKDIYREHPDSTLRIEQGGESTRDLGYVKPGIYVVRQPIHVSQLVLDDMSSFGLKTGDRTFLARGNTGYTFVCEASESGTSSSLADLTMSTLMMAATIIEKTFNLHKVGPFSLSATNSVRKDTEVYETHVTMGLQYDMKWANLNLAPMFKEIVIKASNNETYFIETYTESLLTPPMV